MTGTSKPPEFEQALEELERLVERLERGVALTRHCQASLKTAQAKVEILLRKSGQIEAEPFGEASEVEEDAPATTSAPGEAPPEL